MKCTPDTLTTSSVNKSWCNAEYIFALHHKEKILAHLQTIVF